MSFLKLLGDKKASLGILEKKLPNVAFKAIMKNKVRIINEYLQERQLSKGFSSDESRLSFNTNLGKTTGFYRAATVKKAKLDKPRKPKILGANYNFEWSGNTFDGMNVKKAGNGYKLFTTDPKDLDAIYGKIYDLNQRNQKEVNELFVETAIADEILKSLQI